MILSQPVFSVLRFVSLFGRPELPCWVAGRFAKTDHDSELINRFPELSRPFLWIRQAPKEEQPLFELRGNGARILFSPEKPGLAPKASEGDWLAARLVRLSSCGRFYFASRWLRLARCKRPPAADASRWQTAGKWPVFLDRVKDSFQSRDMLPVETPSLVRCPGTEPHLQPFRAEKEAPGLAAARLENPLFLPTSPEMSLKKLLCRDATDIFEIKKCFRAGELGALHEPEFYLLEWYRAFCPLESLMDDIFALIKSLTNEKPFEMPLRPFKIFTVQELFQKFLGFRLRPDTEKKKLEELAKQKEKLLSDASDYSWGDLFHMLFLRHIEPKLPRGRLVIVRDYPPRLRAFAKINPQGWAERFELYWQGIELANAFCEVTDAAEQERLFQEHLSERGDSVPADRELVALMDEHGMPPCSGAALGLDRLFLILSGNSRISDIRMFASG